MFQAEEYIQKIRDAEHGVPKLELLADAIRNSDEAAAHYWRIYFRYEYVKESIFHEDNFKAIIMFPELLQVFDEHPELEDDTYDDMMQAFKWVLENMPDYYQISLSEIEKYYDEYERRCKKYGFSLRVYYMKKSQFYLTIDREAAKEAYQAFHQCKRDANSDCEACEIHHDMSIALEFDNEADALRIAAPVLDGSKRCGEVPHVTYGALTKYFLYKKQLSEALYYGKLCERYTCNEPEFLAESGYLLELYSMVNPSEGWKIFKRNTENFVRSKNPMLRMTFARGAYRLLQCVAKETEFSNNFMLRCLPIEQTAEGYRIKDLIDYFYDFAKQQSELLDRRNGTDYYMRLLETPLPVADAQDIAKISSGKHGYAPEITATFAAAATSQFPEDLSELIACLQDLPESTELLSHSVDEGVLYLTFRQAGTIYEAVLWLEHERHISGRPCCGIEREDYEQIAASTDFLMLRMNYGSTPLQSMRLAMQILHAMLPDLLGVVDVITQRTYPANWIRFAAAYENALSFGDLVGLYITGSEDSDEIWMTTLGMCALGMREIEVIGANRSNFGELADLLHGTACYCAEQGILPDLGDTITVVSNEETDVSLTWCDVSEDIFASEGSIAKKVERPFPTAALCMIGDNEELLPLTQLPNEELQKLSFPHSHSEYVRRIYLAKETFACFQNALRLPLDRAAARLEFHLSMEMRQKYGYSKELLWAEIEKVDNGKIIAKIAECSDLLPDIHEGDEIEINEENITAWFVKPKDSDSTYTEKDAFYFM